MAQPPIPQSSSVSPPHPRNWLALISFCYGLILLAYMLFNVVIASAFPYPMLPTTSLVDTVAFYSQPWFLLCSFPATVVALVTGVAAVWHARTLPPDRAWREMAWIGLLLGVLYCLFVFNFPYWNKVWPGYGEHTLYHAL
ncbi:MAG TPA: hypothetical protein VFQ25_16885 [Ktedonobacterales bacterium]|nr:hypothetical protein [Ktedonobacterales bacterium]